MYNRNQGSPQDRNRSGKQKVRIKQLTYRQLLFRYQGALDAIGPLRLIDRELIVTYDNGTVEWIKSSQFFLFPTHRANDKLVSAARQYLEGCGPETADIVEQANHTHHALFRQLGRA
jgi:hypothetical protein